MTLLTLDDIRPYMGKVKQRGSETVGDCPMCGKSGHLYAKQEGEKLVVYCQYCNAAGSDILKAFRQLGAQPSQQEQPETDYRKSKPIEDYYHEYKSPAGEVVYKKRRRKWADGHKAFTFEHTGENGKTVYKKPENSIALYNLDLMAAADAGEVLYIVEGEKCADAMIKAGFLATTANTGSQKQIKFTDADKELYYKFANRVIIPDNDDSGQKYIQAFPGAKVLQLGKIWAECKNKSDVADYLAAGGDVEKIKNYIFPPALTLEYFKTVDLDTFLGQELIEQIKALPQTERLQVLLWAKMAAKRLEVPARDYAALFTAADEQPAQKEKVLNYTEFLSQPVKLCCGEWECIDNVYNDFEGEASPIPVLPVEILRNVEEGTEKIRLAYRSGGRWHDFITARSVVANTSKITSLADKGLEVNSDNAGALVKYIADIIKLNRERALPCRESVSHLGWYNDLFLPYDNSITIEIEGSEEALIKAVEAKGSLDDWVNAVQPLWEQYFPVRMAIAASLASCMISKADILPFIFHLWGASGSGKTVSLLIAASVWGKPRALQKTLNDTQNSLIATAALMKNIPLFADELQSKAANAAKNNFDDFIMQFAEGTERGRLDAGAKQRRTRQWQNIAITTGEEPFTKANSGGGAKNRCIELECPDKMIDLPTAQAVCNFISCNYGTAGKDFVNYIRYKDISADYAAIVNTIAEISDTTGKQAMAAAILFLADSYACNAIFNRRDLVLDIKKALPQLVKSRQEVDTAERAYKSIVALVEVNKDNFDAAHGHTGREFWGKIEGDTVTIIKFVLVRELDKLGFDFNAVKKRWAQNGYIIKNSQGKYVLQSWVGGQKGNYVVLKVSR